MNIAIIGATGQIGSDIATACRAAGHKVTALGHDTLDITDAEACARVLGAAEPAVIVNTAAMHQVEQCEADPARSFAVNGIGVRNVAITARSLDATLVHLSTDYVFNGNTNRPYRETDLPQPVNVYGVTKLAGEQFVSAIAPRHFVLRVASVYGRSPCRAKGGPNFPAVMLKLAAERGRVRVVDDEYMSPTCAEDIAQAVLPLVATQRYGVYHAVSSGGCSWYEFAERIFALTNTTVDLQRAAPGEFPAKTPRPAYSILDNAKLASVGVMMPSWQDAIARFLAER